MLSAAFKDAVLHESIDEDVLRGLFQRTIQFLRQSATATSSLRTDMHILEGLQRDLFMMADARTGSSFSSHTSMQTPRIAATSVPMHRVQSGSELGPPQPPTTITAQGK